MAASVPSSKKWRQRHMSSQFVKLWEIEYIVLSYSFTSLEVFGKESMSLIFLCRFSLSNTK